MQNCLIKNLTTNDIVYENLGRIAASSTYEIQNIDEQQSFFNNSQVITDITIGSIQVGSSSEFFTDISKQIKWLAGDIINSTVISQPEPLPFAQPIYRTKNNGTPTIVTIAPNSNANIDLLLTEERYVSGGRVIVKNTELGDYIIAQVVDLDGKIPEAYRAALCENYPVVSTYVEKMWMDLNSKNEIDTRPLNAKISAGLYMRATYYAVNSGTDRQVVINYHMQKKL